MRRGHQHPEGGRAFTLAETMTWPHQECPDCGEYTEWWTWYLDQQDGAWRLSVGRCPECDGVRGTP
ncbi:hypothetical protein [Kineococcus sp. SYSU DK005]|uniref:hypothetical protein n=1 Tax=Kineococcus sp. SYSU DK005 TaxID=3383126 RepID=UPI003D7E9DF5